LKSPPWRRPCRTPRRAVAPSRRGLGRLSSLAARRERSLGRQGGRRLA
jgi:hypothetical protein